MRAFLVTESGVGSVQEVPPPVAAPGQVVVDVALVGICGTDIGLFHADADRMKHLRNTFPLRLGHEWCGTVSDIGEGVDPEWLGRRVTGDTMIGCGHCNRCLSGHHYVCEDRFEIGVRRNWPGALAEKLPVPVGSLHSLGDTVNDVMGAMVEPGGNAYRSVAASGAGNGRRVLVLGPGTIGQLCVLFARAAGSAVHVLGLTDDSLELAMSLGATGAWHTEDLPDLGWDAVIDATGAASSPQRAVDLVEPGGRVVFVGIAGEPSPVDSRTLARKDVTAVGILGASLGLAPTIELYASGAVDPQPLVAATVSLDEVASVLGGWKPDPTSARPKILVDPTK
jgi:threonine dehydrogenase-like Zn-dependent dehydrogenase